MYRYRRKLVCVSVNEFEAIKFFTHGDPVNYCNKKTVEVGKN